MSTPRLFLTICLPILLLTACAAQSPMSSRVESDYAAAPAPAAAPGSMSFYETQVQEIDPATRRVISNARLELIVQDAGDTADRIALLASEAGGYVGSTNLYKTTYGDVDAMRGTITIRVPSESLDRILNQLEELAVDVRARNTDRQDVTDQYTDLEAQLRTLRATENELLELMVEVRAKPNATADEIMAVYHRLTEIRSEIERLQGRLNLLENQVRLSTIEITLVPDSSSFPVLQAGWQPGTEARAALRTLVSATQGFANLLIWAMLFLVPMLLLLLIPLALIFVILRWAYRRFSRPRTPVQPV